ncbi:hypothetical protein R3P38DRAFT_3273240 [Favolaschia claudopus]|uniref:Uncharacterized protein n=1 Tax=Favolaschia claudopus TaxID=2862362 RepID=A0AAW0B1Y0_9AGAR
MSIGLSLTLNHSVSLNLYLQMDVSCPSQAIIQTPIWIDSARLEDPRIDLVDDCRLFVAGLVRAIWTETMPVSGKAEIVPPWLWSPGYFDLHTETMPVLTQAYQTYTGVNHTETMSLRTKLPVYFNLNAENMSCCLRHLKVVLVRLTYYRAGVKLILSWTWYKLFIVHLQGALRQTETMSTTQAETMPLSLRIPVFFGSTPKL